jgi:hypothetical protein
MNSILKLAYNFIRPLIPTTYAEFNDVRVKDVKLFDQTKSFPEYESKLCNQIENFIQEGMNTTIIGGGRGVSTVHAARAVGDTGTIKIYEGSREHVELVTDTIQTNNVSSRVDIRHAVVAADISVYTDTEGVKRINSADLSVTDALVLDCEAAEIAILSEMEIEPNVIIVETHDRLVPGATAAIRHILENREYEIIEEQDHAEGIQVLTATK